MGNFLSRLKLRGVGLFQRCGCKKNSVIHTPVDLFSCYIKGLNPLRILLFYFLYIMHYLFNEFKVQFIFLYITYILVIVQDPWIYSKLNYIFYVSTSFYLLFIDFFI